MAYWNIKFDPQINVEDKEIIILLTKIDSYRDVLGGIPIGQGIRNLFVATKKKPNDFSEGTFKDKMILQDIRSTAAIEGNTLDNKEIKTVIKSDKAKNIQEQEVINLNNVRMFLEEKARTFNGKVTEELIKEVNRRIMDGITEDGETFNGTYRKYNVIVGKHHSPAKFEDVPKTMREFIEFINSAEINNLHPIIKALLAHFYIVSIHPFGNGNGRTSRAIESFLIYYYGYSVHGFHSLNNYWYKNYAEYFNILDESRFKYKGCLQEFVKFGLKGYFLELEKIRETVVEFTVIKAYENFTKELLEKNLITKRQLALIEVLQNSEKEITVQNITNASNPILSALYDGIKNKKTINRDIENLKKMGLVECNEDKAIEVNYNIMKMFTK